MDDAIPIWLEYADGDLTTAEFLYEKQWPRQLEIICYHLKGSCSFSPFRMSVT